MKPQYLAVDSSGRLFAAPPGPSIYPGGISHGRLQTGSLTMRHSRKRHRKAGKLKR